MARRKKNNKKSTIITIIIIILTIIYNFYYEDINNYIMSFAYKNNSYEIGEIPDYDGKDYIYINDNIPTFKEENLTVESFETYSSLDYLGRCGTAYANIGTDLMPSGKRESIGQVKPSGWQTIKYDIRDGKQLYNRCHLIGFQLSGENANHENLITCTRQMNTGVMLEYENKVASYVKSTNNHVLYRVTPIFEGSNLIAKGVQMEGLSVEDSGKGIKFNIFVYNVQNGIEINYKTGESSLK